MCEELVEHPRQRGREDKSKALGRWSSEAAGGGVGALYRLGQRRREGARRVQITQLLSRL